jgi:hypothetical protein
MVNGALDVIHRCIRHAASLKDIQPLFGRLGLELVLDDAVERVSVLDAQCVRDKTRVSLPFWLVNLVAEDAIEFVVAAADCNVCIFGLVCSVWDDGCCSYVSALSKIMDLRKVESEKEKYTP